MTYRCIAQLQEKADNTALLCRLLVSVKPAA
mgnify:CR=1 FL=1